MRADAAESAEAFAADRNRPAAEPIDEIARGGRIPPPRRMPVMTGAAGSGGDGKSYRYVPGQGIVEEDAKQADPREFPLPYVMGGQRPNTADTTPAAGNGRVPAPAAARTPAAAPTPAAKPAPDAADDPDIPAPKKKSAVKIDPRSLEKFLKQNATRTDGP